MTVRISLIGLLGFTLLFGCRKNDDPAPLPPVFEISFQNDFSPLEAQFAVFVSDETGKTRAFQWLPGQAKTEIRVQNVSEDERFDCTVMKMTVIESPGSGLRDTGLVLTTYTGLSNGKLLQLRELDFHQQIDLKVTFSGVSSVDSVIVPDGLTFAKPQPSNNFTGQYKTLHTGKLWLRARVNGQPEWRFFFFDNVGGPTLAVTLNLPALQIIPTPPHRIDLPFLASWQYKVDGLVDTAKLQFLALGDLLRAPGGFVPTFNSFDVFEPEPLPYHGYRVTVDGTDPQPGGFSYQSDRFYENLPDGLVPPAFDVQPSAIHDDHVAAVRCVGEFDALVFSRSNSAHPSISWEVYLKPDPGQFVSYRLPDMPWALGEQFRDLKYFSFGNKVAARAEAYDKVSDYEALLELLFLQKDPLWKPRAGFEAKGRGL